MPKFKYEFVAGQFRPTLIIKHSIFVILLTVLVSILSSSHAYHITVPHFINNNMSVFDAELAAGGLLYDLTPATTRRTSPPPNFSTWVYNTFRIDRRNGSVIAASCSNRTHSFFVNGRTNRINSDRRIFVMYPIYLSFRCCGTECVGRQTRLGNSETTVKVEIGGQTCFAKSQAVASVFSAIPKVMLQRCLVDFRGWNDDLFAVEKRNGDLVVRRDHCFYRSWTVRVPYELDCPEDKSPTKQILFFKFFVNGDSDFNEPISPIRVKRQANGGYNDDNKPPIFGKLLYTVSVPEEQDKGFVVTTMQATDPENTAVSYFSSCFIF